MSKLDRCKRAMKKAGKASNWGFGTPPGTVRVATVPESPPSRGSRFWLPRVLFGRRGGR